MTDTALDALMLALDDALAYDPNVGTAPVALLWPDKERQWESIVPLLQPQRRIVAFGEFDPGHRAGPAYWLRCVIASTVEVVGAPDGTTVVYLPGVSRDDLRNANGATPELVPLAAIQHRSQWFAHPNGKDWTIRALLSNPRKGLGLNVDADGATATALIINLRVLIEQPIARLANRLHRRGLHRRPCEPRPDQDAARMDRRPQGHRGRVGCWRLGRLPSALFERLGVRSSRRRRNRGGASARRGARSVAPCVAAFSGIAGRLRADP